jgi:hypothetical protein
MEDFSEIFDQLLHGLEELDNAVRNPVELISDICITQDFDFTAKDICLDDIIFDVNIGNLLSFDETVLKSSGFFNAKGVVCYFSNRSSSLHSSALLDNATSKRRQHSNRPFS